MKKILLTLMVVAAAIMISPDLNAQAYKKKKGASPGSQNTFLDTQWWLGFRSGINLTMANPTAFYSVFSPVDYSADLLLKDYHNYKRAGVLAGLDITFYHKGWSFAFQPTYRRQVFDYENDYFWFNSESAAQTLNLNYYQTHAMDYAEFPLSVKYDLTRTKFRPFVQAGAFYAILANANKGVTVTGQDEASGGSIPIEAEEFTVGATDLFIRSSTGWMAGIGASYDFWNIRMVLDVQYRHGLNNITDVENRFKNNTLAGIGDALDDMKINNISLNVSFVFPLRFISKGFTAI